MSITWKAHTLNNQGTKLYFLSAKSPSELSEFVRAMPFKIEIKQMSNDFKRLAYTSEEADAFFFQGNVSEIKKRMGVKSSE